MTKGGHANSGPPRDPNALRRNRDAAEWTRLPAGGRSGPAPVWPLSKATKREESLWADEWRRPQAVQWELNGQELEVAFYVRTVASAEKPRASSSLLTLVRQYQESLGISMPGLLRNRWIIDHGPNANTTTAPAKREQRSARERLKVLDKVLDAAG